MSANGVVEHLNVIEHIGGCHRPGRIDSPFDSFLFQRTEETLRHGIVVTIPTTTHARHHMVRFQKRLPVVARELTALIRLDHDTRFQLASPYCCRKRNLKAASTKALGMAKVVPVTLSSGDYFDDKRHTRLES